LTWNRGDPVKRTGCLNNHGSLTTDNSEGKTRTSVEVPETLIYAQSEGLVQKEKSLCSRPLCPDDVVATVWHLPQMLPRDFSRQRQHSEVM
jgi:hypothetical protein